MQELISGLPQHSSTFAFSVTFTQASSIENKQDWIKHIREVIQERTVHLKGALKEPIHIPKPSTAKHKARRYNLRPVKPSYIPIYFGFHFYYFIAFNCFSWCAQKKKKSSILLRICYSIGL